MENISNDTEPENITDTRKIFVVDFRIYYRYGFEYYLYGYFLPIWTILNITAYSIMIYVFIKHNLTSKTHTCLIALAVSDSIAPVFPSFFWFYFFVVKKEFYHVPYDWCRAFHYLTEVVPRLFTYMSYFLTVMLAVQRYVVVVHPFKADVLCSSRMTYIMIASCFVTAILVRLIHFFHYSYVSKTITLPGNINKTREVCAFGDPQWLHIKYSRYSAILRTIHTIIVNIIPCTVLIVVVCLMLKALRDSSVARRKMTENTGKTSKFQSRERRLTYTTISVTTVLLLYKVPTILMHILDIFRAMFGITLVNNFYDLWTANVIMDVFYWLCTPSNFLITCCLSREFRLGLRKLIKGPNIYRQSAKNTSSVSSTTTSTHV